MKWIFKQFNKTAFILTVALFVAEVLIAACVHDEVIRPHGGDFLVVIFLYCLVQSFFCVPVNTACLAVLVFAYVVEISQYFHLVAMLGLQHSRLAVIILGTTFSWVDMLCYTAGILLVWTVEKINNARKAATARAAITVK